MYSGIRNSTRKFAGLLLLALLLSGCGNADNRNQTTVLKASESEPAETKAEESKTVKADYMKQEDNSPDNKLNEIPYTTASGRKGYLYITEEALNHPDDKRPLVLVMTYTTGEARDVVNRCGWKEKALSENLILIAPDYNNYATYSETEGIMDGVRYAIDHYPVDTERVYSTGFSNGGAASVAMVSRYPDVFAAISAMGWMVDMQGQDSSYDIPFQVIQGTKEYTQKINGQDAIMDDEREAIRSLLLYNEMITNSTGEDYGAVPYWGYKPYESSKSSDSGDSLTVSHYYKSGFDMPFAEFVLIDGAGHTTHPYEAEMAWNFMKNIKRTKNGIEETKETADYDFSVFQNVELIHADLSNMSDEELSVLYQQARYCQAMTEADIDTMRDIVAEDTVFTHMSGKQQSREEYFSDVANGNLRYYTIGIDTPVIEVNGNTASVTYTSVLNANAYGARGTYHMKGTHYYKKTDGKWRAVNKPQA